MALQPVSQASVSSQLVPLVCLVNDCIPGWKLLLCLSKSTKPLFHFEDVKLPIISLMARHLIEQFSPSFPEPVCLNIHYHYRNECMRMYTFIKAMLPVAWGNHCVDSIQRQLRVQGKTFPLYNSNACFFNLVPSFHQNSTPPTDSVFRFSMFKDENHQANDVHFIVITRRKFKIWI